MIGQLVSFVPAEIHQSSYQRCGPRGVDAIFIGFDEENGIIKNIAKLIPLEALLTGSGSSRLITTKDWKVQGPQRLFPLARLREWQLTLEGAKLWTSVSRQDFEKEIDRLVDPEVPYVPQVLFEQPVGVSHRMGHKGQGPWLPEIEDHVESSSNPLAVLVDKTDTDMLTTTLPAVTMFRLLQRVRLRV